MRSLAPAALLAQVPTVVTCGTRTESVPPSSHDLRAPALQNAPLKMTAVSFAKPCSSIVSRILPALASVQLTAARYFRRWSCCSVIFAGSPVAQH
eukprot:COSAG04_NODE_21391_length_374_cov_0.938182_1_plen_94_part_10